MAKRFHSRYGNDSRSDITGTGGPKLFVVVVVVVTHCADAFRLRNVQVGRIRGIALESEIRLIERVDGGGDEPRSLGFDPRPHRGRKVTCDPTTRRSYKLILGVTVPVDRDRLRHSGRRMTNRQRHGHHIRHCYSGGHERFVTTFRFCESKNESKRLIDRPIINFNY